MDVKSAVSTLAWGLLCLILLALSFPFVVLLCTLNGECPSCGSHGYESTLSEDGSRLLSVRCVSCGCVVEA